MELALCRLYKVGQKNCEEDPQIDWSTRFLDATCTSTNFEDGRLTSEASLGVEVAVVCCESMQGLGCLGCLLFWDGCSDK